jgi:hydrogenase/urease accessory protein HupE
MSIIPKRIFKQERTEHRCTFSVFSVISGSIPLLVGLMLSASASSAHELRPAYLELRETAPDTFDAVWKVPAAGDNLRLGLYVRLPESCVNLSEPLGRFSGGAYLERWRVKARNGLAGERIIIDGLASTMTDVLVRMERLNGATQVTRLTPDSPSFVVEASPGHWQVMRTYLGLGVEHILTGIDHLLFVLALIIITRGGWKLVQTVTAFTISHSLTLTAATLGFVHLPQRPVEAIIALSIVFVAAEILHTGEGRQGLTARAPWIVAFTFGLLHGLGFAGGLSEAGLPQGHIPLALLFFSLGVETGHFLFVGVVLALLAQARRTKLSAPQWVQLVPPYAIGGLAMFWVIQRIAAF